MAKTAAAVLWASWSLRLGLAHGESAMAGYLSLLKEELRGNEVRGGGEEPVKQLDLLALRGSTRQKDPASQRHSIAFTA